MAAAGATEPAAPEDVYGLCKRYVEVLGEACRAEGMRFAALRMAVVVGPGARGTASPWRSAPFEALTARAPVVVEIPYRPGEVVPLVHVDGVARMLARLAEASPAHTLYNSPAESWRCGELAAHVAGLNPHVRLSCGHAPVEGIPQVLDGRRFEDEFGFASVPLRQRLADAASAR